MDSTPTRPSPDPDDAPVAVPGTGSVPEASRGGGSLRHPDSSVRLQAAMAAGTYPEPRLVGLLIERCAVEPDFFVRDMLTWALVRHPRAETVPRLVGELESVRVQARSQALHTLSKIGDASAWPAITEDHLLDGHDEVARAAWRAAVTLVPAGSEAGLAEVLGTQLGRGDRDVQRSLSRALVELGDAVIPVLRAAVTEGGPCVRAHARATERMLADPEAAFDSTADHHEPRE